MNTTGTVVVTGIIVVAGRWQQDKPIDVKIAVGGAFLAIGLSVLANFNENFAKAMAYMVLIAALYEYLPALVKAAGFGGELGKASKRRI